MGAMPLTKDGYSLFGCTVAPGFDFTDFQLAHLEAMKRFYPQHRALFEKFAAAMTNPRSAA
jgi:uncharacterized protein